MHGSQREHSHRWPLPAAPAAPGHRLASASPRTAGRSRLSTAPGSAESGARRRDGRGLVGKSLNDSGQHADLGQHPVGAVQVPAEPEPLRRKGALRARRSPAQPPQPPGLPHSAAGPAPTMALPLDSRRLRLRDPEPIPGPCRAPGPAHRKAPPTENHAQQKKPRPPKAPPRLCVTLQSSLRSALFPRPPGGAASGLQRTAVSTPGAAFGSSVFISCLCPSVLIRLYFQLQPMDARLVQLLPTAAPASCVPGPSFDRRVSGN